MAPSPNPGRRTTGEAVGVEAELETAERLRHAVARLARLLRQQDESDLGATATATLASVRKLGPLTLGELAAREQVSPPTMTRIVEKLETKGFVKRQVDSDDRRVSRATITPAGKRYLESTRTRRTAWLAARLGALDPDQYAQVGELIDTLEIVIDDRS